MKHLVLFTGLILASCGSPESDLKDAFSYSEGGRSYFLTGTNNKDKIHIHRCADLTVVKDHDDAKKKCETKEKHVYYKDTLQDSFSDSVLNEKSKFRGYMTKLKRENKLNEVHENIKSRAAKKKKELTENINKLEEKISSLTLQLGKLSAQIKEIELFAVEVGGEDYLGSDYTLKLESLRGVKDSTEKLLSKTQGEKSIATQMLSITHFELNEVKKDLGTFLDRVQGSNILITHKPSHSSVWSHYIDFLYNNVASEIEKYYMVGIYEASSDHSARYPPRHPAEVTIHGKDRVTLVLTSYEPVLWKIATPDGAKISKVYVSGYYRSEVNGVPKSHVEHVKWGDFYKTGSNDYSQVLENLRKIDRDARPSEVRSKYRQVTFTFGK